MPGESHEDDRILPLPKWKRIARALVALIIISGLLYITGVYQHFFLRRTPAGIEQPALPSKVEASQLVVPVVVHILSGPTGSVRTEDDVYRLVENANNIWSQANISFHIQEVKHIPATADDLRVFELQPHRFIEESNSYNPDVANIYLTRTLAGVNGLAYGGTNAVSVADYTSTLDFRTLAHEFGHLLGLDHVSGNRSLMSSGAAGKDLTEQEISAARERAGLDIKKSPLEPETSGGDATDEGEGRR
ncbi:MAG: zinc-dependent metalloprotease family protein [Candidatus Andersenbacteria bacterium]